MNLCQPRGLSRYTHENRTQDTSKPAKERDEFYKFDGQEIGDPMMAPGPAERVAK